MSLLFPLHETGRRSTVSENMCSSSFIDHTATESSSCHHTARRRRKHKHKHKKHRHKKIRGRCTADKYSSNINLKVSNKAESGSLSINDKSSGDHLEKGNEFSGPIEEMHDFTWLTTELKFSDITDTFGSEVSAPIDKTISSPEPELSQRKAPSSSFQKVQINSESTLDERALIEQSIQEKYAEMDVLLKKIHSKRHRSRRRRKYCLRKYDSAGSDECGPWISGSVNIYPIKREKRCAKPIREALLVRTAMRKAWKGLLGSCCGKGCWATWRWISLRGVISDYE